MAQPLRQIVACPACSMQFDATSSKSGDHVHCGCGEVVTVPEPKPHEAAVVRCSACGAPRDGSRSSCAFCDSSFTLHERDLHTICPGCMARVSDRGRYCHSCGTSISPQATVGERTEFECPACEGAQLISRRLDERQLAVLECGACAGMWVGADLFAQLASDAEQVKTAVEALGAGVAGSADVPLRPIEAGTRLYRPCPECCTLMHRRNYGRKSGVIVDTCRDHGVWFDHGELAQILRWLRSGGARRANVEVGLEQRSTARHETLYGPKAEPSDFAREQRPLGGLVRPLIDFLGYFV